MMSSKYTFKRLAEDVLADAGKPMGSEEIWSYAIEHGFADKFDTNGKTPQASIGAQIYTDIRDNQASPFVQVSRHPALFGLRAWPDVVLDMTPTYTLAELVRDVLASVGNPMSVDEVFDHAVDTGLDQRLSGTVKGLTKSSLNTCMNGMARGDAPTLRKTSTKPTRFDFVDGAAPTKIEDATTDDGVPVNERDLHPLLTTFVRSNGHFKCRTKTIHHEISVKGPHGSDRWSYPDLVGVYYPFDDYEGETVGLIETLRDNPYKVFSFEMKWKLDTGTLREKYFQAVSNSSWANEGYIVAPTISTEESFLDDLSRLVNAFGIGVIRLDVENIEQSEILFPAAQRERLDWATVDRLVARNADFRRFVADINADAKTGMVRGSFDKAISPEEYDDWIAGTSVARLLPGKDG